MAILERRVQFDIKDANAYREWEKTWEGVESRLGGFPPKRHYWLISGSEMVGTMVWERDWESFAVMEAAYDRMFGNAEVEQLASKSTSVVGSERIEYYHIQ